MLTLATLTIFGTTLTAATAKGEQTTDCKEQVCSSGLASVNWPRHYWGNAQNDPAKRAFARSSAVYWRGLAQKRLRLLGKRERRIVALEVTVHKLRAGHLKRTAGVETGGQPASVRSIICQVFGSQCSKALSVAWCESRMNIYARNGQYLGLFQEGDYARSRYGFAWDALTQARSAHRYFLDAGWSPWTCAA